jgi:hypothetical protein
VWAEHQAVVVGAPLKIGDRLGGANAGVARVSRKKFPPREQVFIRRWAVSSHHCWVLPLRLAAEFDRELFGWHRQLGRLPLAERIVGLLAVRWEGLGWWGLRRRPARGFRFPVEIISHCVWLCHRFPPSFREVEEMMLERGIGLWSATRPSGNGVPSSARPTPTPCAGANALRRR